MTYSDQPYYQEEQRTKKLPLLLMVLVGLALLAVLAWWVVGNRHIAAAPVMGKFGAIATSQSSMDFGSAWGYSDGAAAERRAVAECNAHVSSADCVVRLSLSGTCGGMAVSASRGKTIVVNDSDKTLAGALALAQCQAEGADDCILRQAFCGDGS